MVKTTAKEQYETILGQLMFRGNQLAMHIYIKVTTLRRHAKTVDGFL